MLEKSLIIWYNNTVEVMVGMDPAMTTVKIKCENITERIVEIDRFFKVQVVSWYDNENSYVSQMVRTIKYFAEI